MKPISLRDRVSAILSRDDDLDRICEGIPDNQCTSIRRNARLNILNGAASKLAEQIASAKLLIPWLMGLLGAPAWLLGFVVPIRQAGTRLPQLAVSAQIRRFPVRKCFWVGAAGVQMIVLILVDLAAWRLPGGAATGAVLILLLVYSAGRGMGSIPFQGVAGKTLPKGRRRRVLAARSTIGGLLTLGAGLALNAFSGRKAGILEVSLLTGLSTALWGVAALAMAAVVEHPGATA